MKIRFLKVLAGRQIDEKDIQLATEGYNESNAFSDKVLYGHPDQLVVYRRKYSITDKSGFSGLMGRNVVCEEDYRYTPDGRLKEMTIHDHTTHMKTRKIYDPPGSFLAKDVERTKF